MQQRDFDEVVSLILKEDHSYARSAYQFLRLALDFTLKQRSEKNGEPPSHVRGPELLDGLRLFALEQYGPLAKAVFQEWGITSGLDFGHIVFNLVDFGLLGKTDEDSLEDFAGQYDFDEVFLQPFQPAKPIFEPARNNQTASSLSSS